MKYIRINLPAGTKKARYGTAKPRVETPTAPTRSEFIA